METLMSRFQVADSSNAYNPFGPGQEVMGEPCVPHPSGLCMSRIGHVAGAPGTFVFNPPPEYDFAMQRAPDPDVQAVNEFTSTRTRSIGGAGAIGDPKRQQPPQQYRDTVGASSFDIPRGHMLLPSGGDMPLVRRCVFFDTRYRDPDVVKDATRVTFMLDRPIDSVSRICLHSARVPICIDRYNPGLEAEDYVMLSIGLPLQDVVCPINQPQRLDAKRPKPEFPLPTPPMTPVWQNTAPTFSRALAYVPLIPATATSKFAYTFADLPPCKWYVDFMKPIPSIDRIELSWWRFQKEFPTSATAAPTEYVIHNSAQSGVGAVNENAYVSLYFYGKNRRPE